MVGAADPGKNEADGSADINASRGRSCRQALIDAPCGNKQIAGAAIDVVRDRAAACIPPNRTLGKVCGDAHTVCIRKVFTAPFTRTRLEDPESGSKANERTQVRAQESGLWEFGY